MCVLVWCCFSGLARPSFALPRPRSLRAGGVLACSNLLAGRLCDWTAAAGRGGIGCFLGGAVACVLSGAALLAFSTWGELGRDDLLPGAAAVKAA